MKILKLAAIAVFAIAFSGCSTMSAKNSASMGLYSFSDGNFGEAAERFKRAVEQEPANTGNLAMLGWSYFKFGDYDAAISTFDKLEDIDAFALDAYMGRGWCNFKKSDFDKAIAYFEEARLIAPSSSEPYAGLGWCNFKKGEIALARKHLNEALRKAMQSKGIISEISEDKTLWNAMIKLLSMPIGVIKGNVKSLLVPVYLIPDMASDIESEKLNSSKTDPEAHRALGYLNFSEGNYKTALKHFKIAVQLMPGWNDARIKWGDCLFSLEKYNDAAVVYRYALEHGQNAEIYDKIGWSYYNLAALNTAQEYKMYEKAYGMFQEALAIDPNYANSLSGLSQVEKKVL